MKNSYDVIPYNDSPYECSIPSWLYVIAKIYGLTPPDFRNARILELGCAKGSNIVPIAFRYPNTKCLGVDYSEVQIDKGQALLNNLDIHNIELKCMDLCQFDESYGEFDYIIVHGVYSWVPKHISDKILQICSQNLSEHGIAYVSYNVLPGWNTIKTIRDLMLFHVQNLNEPKNQVAQAKSILNLYANELKDADNAYGKFLVEEAVYLSVHKDAYIHHEHLEAVNTPIYVKEFIARAEQKGLQYVSDSLLKNNLFVKGFPISQEVMSRIESLASYQDAMQYSDFFTNRRFRRTLLCKNKHNVNHKKPERSFKDFFISLDCYPLEVDRSKILTEGYILALKHSSSNSIIKMNKISHKLVMMVLFQQQGRLMSYEQLRDKLLEITKNSTKEQIEKLLDNDLNLFNLYSASFIKIYPFDTPFLNLVSDKPQVSKLARLFVKENDFVINQLHQRVGLDECARQIIQYLDGENTISMIEDKVLDLSTKKDLFIENQASKVNREVDKIVFPEEIVTQDNVKAYTADVLGRFAKNKLLIG